MAELMAEVVDVEFESVVVARPNTNLIEVGQVFIHLFNIILLGEGVADALFELAMVTFIIEQHGISFLAVASGASCFLEIGLDAVRTVDVDDQTHIGLVDAHAESICCHHHTDLVLLPGILSLILDSSVETGMIEGGTDA